MGCGRPRGVHTPSLPSPRVSPAAAPNPEVSSPRRAARLPVLISALSGTTGFVIKIAFLSVSNALAIWAVYALATRHNWIAVAGLAAVTAAIDFVYLVRRAPLPMKFLVPGTLLLVAFQLIPIIYTIDTAFTNYSTSHLLSKADAIQSLPPEYTYQPPNAPSYNMAIAQSATGYSLILRDDATGKFYIGTKSALTPVASGSVTFTGGKITAAKGYTVAQGIVEINSAFDAVSGLKVPAGHGHYIGVSDPYHAVTLKSFLRYDAKRDVFVVIAKGTSIPKGTVYRDDGNGEFAAPGQQPLQTGWKTYIGGANFSTLIHNSNYRSPFIRIFIWTFVFAASTVFLSFAIGLLLAIALDKRGMRFQRTYRSLLIIPWAVPGFLSLLVWGGLLNNEFGVVNRILHLDVQWLVDANWARFSCILVSTWLTIPYFFVVSMGALQSIPGELVEAARVDGASALQVFRKITLPLLLVAVGPLLIASFAFNFNNFNNIYLLTRGGPIFSGGNGIAGATDILISYTYKIGISSGLGQNYGLASAITIIIFLITAALSTVGFSRTRVLEDRA